MSDLEKSLVLQISDIERRIRELQEERAVVERLLLKTRKERVASKEVTRRNSVQRILVESEILEALKGSNRPLSGKELFTRVRRVVFNLNYSTMRSHLRRMKERGVLKKLPGYGGNWTLPEG